MPTIAPWAFVLAVPDLARSADYFRDVLGFRVVWEDASDWRLAERDGLRVMLGHCPRDALASEVGSHNWFGYISVDDVDALYTELAARGAVCTRPTDTAYGMREIVVTTPDGHRIVFGQDAPRCRKGQMTGQVGGLLQPGKSRLHRIGAAVEFAQIG